MNIKKLFMLCGVIIMCSLSSGCEEFEELFEVDEPVSTPDPSSSATPSVRSCPIVTLPNCQPNTQAWFFVEATKARLRQFNHPTGCAGGASTDAECLRFCRIIQQDAIDTVRTAASFGCRV